MKSEEPHYIKDKTLSKNLLRTDYFRIKNWRTLTARILTINIFAFLILVGGLLYLNQFREGLITAKINSLKTEGKIIAGALSEGAIISINSEISLNIEESELLLRRMIAPTLKRGRIFDANGNLIADSRSLIEAGRTVQSEHLPKKLTYSFLEKTYNIFIKYLSFEIFTNNNLPEYRETESQKASDYSEVNLALLGKTAVAKRKGEKNIILTAAIPIQSFKKVQGALLLSANTADIDLEVREFRLTILKISTLILIATILLSLYLASTIARPVRLLAAAANRVRQIHNRQVEIPDFTYRHDEIGNLSGALREMTEALYMRIDAIEAFAADVAHEIKNPLASLKSAVESFEKSKDNNQKEKLLTIISSDVNRIDRLITDISNASRVDAELSREKKETVNLKKMLETILFIYKEKNLDIDFSLNLQQPNLTIKGIEERLGQVIKNLIDNAISFTPEKSKIKIFVKVVDKYIILSIEDQGPGFPSADLNKIFDRFYTHRPNGETFGKHSGLGLSISQQIIKAHGGELVAENIKNDLDLIIGARIIMKLPLFQA